MLSRIEREYVEGKLITSMLYARVLRFRIKKKLKQFFEEEFPLLEKKGITEFYNGITENNNAEKNLFGNCWTHKVALGFPPI